MLNQKDYLYLDENIENFSNIATGIIVQKIGEQKNIAYIDIQNSAKKLINFLENLCLSHTFIKNLKKFNLDIFTQNKNSIQKTILPNVEYLNISKDIFLKSIKNYDVIILDNFKEDFEAMITLKDILSIKNENTQLVVLTSDKENFLKIKSNFSNRIVCNYKKQSNLVTRKGLINITGKSKGKTLFAIGYLIRKYLYKNDVKLVYFDKGGDIFGDANFFKSLKEWNQDNSFYGTFDFVKTGVCIDDKKDIELNKVEAEDALMLFKTALKKQAPVIGDELNTVIQKKYLNVQDVIKILQETKNEVILTGETSKVELNKITEVKIVLKKVV